MTSQVLGLGLAGHCLGLAGHVLDSITDHMTLLTPVMAHIEHSGIKHGSAR